MNTSHTFCLACGLEQCAQLHDRHFLDLDAFFICIVQLLFDCTQ